MNGLTLGNKKLLISQCFVNVKWATPTLVSLSRILSITNNFDVVKPYEPWLAMKLKISFAEFWVSPILTPKITWDQKLVDCSLGSLYEEIFFKNQLFLLDKWTTYFISFPGTPSSSNSDSVWACGEVLFKTGFKFIFLVFFEEPPTCSHVAETA
jgi:hypothetical protein